MSFTWAKYRDEWGVRGPQTEMTPGRVIEVVRKDGKRASVRIGAVVARFSGDGMAIALVEAVVAKNKGGTKAPVSKVKTSAPSPSPAPVSPAPKCCAFCGSEIDKVLLPSTVPDLCGACAPLDFGASR